MNTKIFRQVALERLSSPEQLDQLLRVASPRHWLALAGVGVLLTTAVAWSVKGTVETKAAGEGVIIRRGGVLNVVTTGAGTVLELPVKVGDHIRSGQRIARIAQPALVERIRLTKETLEEARRERDRAAGVQASGAKLQVASIDRQKANAEREIKDLEEQARLAAEQVPLEERLLARGLTTRQAVIAAQQRVVGIRQQIEAQRALIKQLEAQRFAAETAPAEVTVDRQARIASLERDLAALEKELEMTAEVVSPYNGQVTELKVYTGGVVGAGSAILSVQLETETLEALVYLPSAKAKDARAGMEAQVSPSTVKREEYGYLKGRVVSVADYPATSEALMRNFENQSLTDALMRDGPVTELRVSLEADAKAPSGFRWSSPLGPPTRITSGTLCQVQIVTREEKPIRLLFPAVKEKLGISWAPRRGAAQGQIAKREERPRRVISGPNWAPPSGSRPSELNSGVEVPAPVIRGAA